MTNNRRQQIVEIMSDSARQNPQAFEPLRVLNLGFQAHALFFCPAAIFHLSPQLTIGLLKFRRSLLDHPFKFLARAFGLVFELMLLGDVASDRLEADTLSILLNQLDILPEPHFAAISGMGLIYSELGADAPALHWLERALEVHPYLRGLRARVLELRRKLRRDQV